MRTWRLPRGSIGWQFATDRDGYYVVVGYHVEGYVE